MLIKYNFHSYKLHWLELKADGYVFLIVSIIYNYLIFILNCSFNRGFFDD